MGFSWAPFLAQTANRYQMGRSIPGGSSYLTYRRDDWVVNSEQSRLAHYVYIDNLGILGIDPEEVRKTWIQQLNILTTLVWASMKSAVRLARGRRWAYVLAEGGI